MRVYVAGKFTAKERLAKRRAELEELGFEVVSSWLLRPGDDAVPGTSVAGSEELSREMAMADWAEIGRADILILDTIDDSCTGGREVELGMALGNGCSCYSQGTRTFRVGPVRNVFHTLCEGFDTWEDLMSTLVVEYIDVLSAIK